MNERKRAAFISEDNEDCEMKRVIKFRAWHQGMKRWVTAEELELVHRQPAIPSLDERPEAGAITFDLDQTHLIYSQWTGISDASGRDIFEGDVLECPDDNERTLVSYRMNGFYRCNDFHGFITAPSPDCNVIGNIYENPDLIANGKKASPK
jgi:hypothetical protein